MKFLIILILIMLTSNLFCGENDTMKKYIQPFSNRQLNSLLTLECKAKGKLKIRYKHSKDNLTGHNKVNSLFIIKENIVLLDAGWCGRLVNLETQQEIGMQKKSELSFIVLENNCENFYFINGRIGTIKNTKNFLSNTKKFYIAILAISVSQELFYPDQETYIAASNYPPSPRTDPEFFILKADYERKKTYWKHRFNNEEAPRCPVSSDDKIVVGLKNRIIAINTEGTITTILKGEFIPLALSIGYDKNIYSLLSIKKSIVLKSFTFDGEELFEYETKYKYGYHIHPPIVSLASIVYIISGEKIEAFCKVGKLWEYPLENVTNSQVATVLEDESLLISTGNNIIYLDEFGKEIWKYSDEKNKPFLTQPIIDHKGRVLAATNEDIVILE